MGLFYREIGEGQPMVVLHGVFGSSDNWLTVSKELAEKNKVFLVDQRNHGQSFHSPDFNYTELAKDLADFIKEHDIADPIIIGHSMGGKTAMNFASLYPESLKKLIVVDISPRYYRKHHEQILDGLNSINLKELKSRQEADQQLSKFIPEIPVRQFLLKNLYRNHNNEFSWRINLDVLTEKIENIGDPLKENVKISIPTLFIKGSESKYISAKDEELMKEIFSDVQIKTIEGASHWVHAEKPKEFIEALRDFLED